jgi:hypothetical protein
MEGLTGGGRDGGSEEEKRRIPAQFLTTKSARMKTWHDPDPLPRLGNQLIYRTPSTAGRLHQALSRSRPRAEADWDVEVQLEWTGSAGGPLLLAVGTRLLGSTPVGCLLGC